MLVALSLACATAAPPAPTGASDVARVLPAATAALARRGLVLTEAPTIVVHETAEAFRAATGQRDPSLRAWTTWQTIHLMPLRTWARHDDVGVQQRMTHELCHAAIYQRFGSEERARAVRIPKFFDEGVCSVIAGQERPDLATIAFIAPPLPFQAGFFLADPEIAYAAAHHAIAFLDRKLEPRWLEDVLARAAADGTAGAVERALLEVTGYDPASLWHAVKATVAAPA